MAKDGRNKSIIIGNGPLPIEEGVKTNALGIRTCQILESLLNSDISVVLFLLYTDYNGPPAPALVNAFGKDYRQICMGDVDFAKNEIFIDIFRDEKPDCIIASTLYP